MTAITTEADYVWRDGPEGSPHYPLKSDIRAWARTVDGVAGAAAEYADQVEAAILAAQEADGDAAVAGALAGTAAANVVAAGKANINGDNISNPLAFRVSIDANYVVASSDSGRNWATITAPYSGPDGFIDNVLAIQNKSQGAGGTIRGNAAINFLDSNGTEKAAVGYSRNSSLLPDGGYGPNQIYIECGNPFATLNPSDFNVIVTMKAGSAFWGGAAVAYPAISVSSQNGGINLTTNGGAGAISLRDDTYFGYDNSPRTVHFNMTNTRARLRERGTANDFALGTNITNMAAPLGATITRDDATKTAWSMAMGGGTDTFYIARAAVGANTQSNLVRLDGSSSTLSLFGSDDASGPGPLYVLDRASASPSAADELGEIRYQGRSSTGVTRIFASLRGGLIDPANTAETGDLTIRTVNSGTMADAFQFRNKRIRVGIAGDPLVQWGDGSPEGVVTAPISSLYPSTNGKLYFKATGAGNTGWREVAFV